MLCPDCFKEGYSDGVCPSCGYSREKDKNVTTRFLAPGNVLDGRYYTGRVLGAGGFGITYKAIDLMSQEVCCIKEYAPSDLCTRQADGHSLEVRSKENELLYQRGLERFMEEAQTLSRLDDIPSVVKIYEAFKENYSAYFVMEYLDGSDLKKLTVGAKRRPDPKWLVDVILQVALSMDVIHVKTGIIHRDISPENIYITKDGKVKLIDFGNAKQTSHGIKAGFSVILKKRFAPPEQFSKSMAQGAFTDVYSLASTFYYIATGQYLPTAPDRIAGEKYSPLDEVVPEYSETVSEALDHALMLNINDRTPSMQVFVSELTQQKIATDAPYLILKISGHGLEKRSIPLDQTLSVGRSKNADIVVDTIDRDISRIHLQISYSSGQKVFFVMDLSTNGTFVQNTKLIKNKVYQINPPAILILAKIGFQIELGVDHEYQ